MEVSEKIIITNDMVHKFAEVSGDRNPIHIDDEYASKTIFGKRIVHGMLLSSLFSKMIAETYPGKGSIYLNQSLNFKNPCYINDEVVVTIKLLNEIDGKYTLRTTIHRDDIILVHGDALVLKRLKV